MATKKQKRLAMIQKREDELAATIASGLLAQEKDRKQRALRAQAIKAKAQKENERIEASLVSAKINAMAGITHSVTD